jgi:Phage minor capsid protein 2
VATDGRIPADTPANALAALYDRATRRLGVMLATAIRSDQIGTAAYRQQQLTLATAILNRLRSDAQPHIALVSIDAYARGAGMATQLTDTKGIGFGVIHQQAVHEIARALATRLDVATTEVGRRHADVYRRVGLERVGQGLIVRETRRVTSQAIMRDLQHEGITGFEDRAGRRWKLSTYSRMVARTTSREAVSIATRNRLVEVGRPAVTISDHDTDTPLCEIYEGKTYTLDRSIEDRYPLLRALPPFHPNCKHVMHPALTDLNDAIRALQKADTYEDVLRLIGASGRAGAAAA